MNGTNAARALLLTAPRTLEWHTYTLSDLGENDALVRTLRGAVSLGTELPIYTSTSRNPERADYPKMTGYETYGVVEAVGAAVNGLQVGDYVVHFQGHVTRAVVPAARLVPVPRDLDPRLALLLILSNDVKRGVLKLGPKPDKRVLVTGAGAIGLLTLFVLKSLGVAQADVVEPLVERRELARSLGATNIFAPEELHERGATYTVGFECSSRQAAFILLQEKLEPHGRICVLADGNLEPLTLTPAFHQKELRVVGSSDGEDYREHAAWFLGLPELTRLERLFDLEVSAEDLPQTFARLAIGEIQPVKVLVRYGDG